MGNKKKGEEEGKEQRLLMEAHFGKAPGIPTGPGELNAVTQV